MSRTGAGVTQFYSADLLESASGESIINTFDEHAYIVIETLPSGMFKPIPPVNELPIANTYK